MTPEGTRWQRLATVDSIPCSGLAFAYPCGATTESGILIRTASGVRAFRNVCRHLHVRLDRTDPGRFATLDGRWLVCGEHGARYRPDDGMCVEGPCLGAALRGLPVLVREGTVYLDTEAIKDPFSTSKTSA